MSQCCFKLTARKVFSVIVLLSMILSLSPGLIMTAQAQTPDPNNPTVVPQATDDPAAVEVTQVPATQEVVQPNEAPTTPATQNGENGWRISTDPNSGAVRFMGSDSSNPIFSAASLGGVSAQSSDVAAAFLQAFGSRFGIGDPAKELVVMRTNTDAVGNNSVRYQQIYQGVPVLGREMIVQTDPAQNVISASGKVSTGLSLDVNPSADPTTASQKALDATAAKYPDEDAAQLTASPASLWVYDSDALGFRSARSIALVWKIVVSAKNNHPISEVVLVDAHNGLILLNFSQVDSGLNRIIVDCYYSDNDCWLARTETAIYETYTDVTNAFNYFGTVYNYYKNNFGRDSYDGRGSQIIAFTYYTDMANAFWQGSAKAFFIGPGFAVLDVLGHEFTHGVTQYESGLIYLNQSGAINESMSDVFGEFIDQANGEPANHKWEMGQDLPGGAIRSMKDPANFYVYDYGGPEGDPDKISSSDYYCGGSDNGGVHQNSGVNNKAAYLMTDGDTFNGFTVNGIGKDKVAAIYYEAQANLLTSSTTYPDLYDGLNQACVNLESKGKTNAGDCANVKLALDAVEMDTAYACPVNGYVYPATSHIKAPLSSVPVVTNTPELDWELKTDSTRYQVWIKDSKNATVFKQWVDGLDGNVCSNSTSTCNIITPPLYYGSTYSWSVQTSNAVGDGLWSPWSKFSIAAQPASMPTITQDLPQGTITTITPTYQWEPVTGASDYVVTVTNPLTAKTVYSLDFLDSKVCIASGCSASPINKLSPGSFIWTVQAKYGKVAGSVGSPMPFTVYTAPGQPVLNGPTGAITDSKPQFSWSYAAGSTSYILKLTGNSGNVQHEYTSADAGCADVSSTKCSVPSPKVLEGGAHKWTVQAKNGVGLGKISLTAAFTVSSPLDKAVLTSPVGDITSSRLLFKWNAVSLATTYAITLQGATKLAKTYTAANICDTTTCSVDLGVTLKAGAHTWTVKASNKAGYSISAPASFNAPIPAATPGLITLPNPAIKAKVALPDLTAFTWTSALNATDYLLVITGKGFSYSQSMSASTAGCQTYPSTCTAAAPSLGYGPYSWAVTAIDLGVYGKQSALISFSTILPAPKVNQPVSGSPATLSKLEFNWDNLKDATRYDLAATMPIPNSTTSKIMYKTSVLASSVCDVSSCKVIIPTFASGSYVWTISGYNLAGGNGLIHTENFTIGPLLDSEFNTDASGWSTVSNSNWWWSNGKWNVTGPDTWDDQYTSNSGTYTDLDYQVNVLLKGDRYAASDSQSIIVHAAFDPSGTVVDSGYIFSIAGLGDFSVYRKDGASTWSAMQPWTVNSAIKKGTITNNTLRVITNGSTMYFYINGQLVWVGTDGTYSSGQVGIGLWYYDTGDMLSADWALVYDAPALQLHASPSAAQKALNQAAAGVISSEAATSKPVAAGPKR